MNGQESNRTKRRDRERHRKRHGMRVSGRRLGELTKNVIIKKLKEKDEDG